MTCAWSALDATFSSKWLCFDSDVNDGALDRLEDFLRSHGWRVIREGRREGRAGHLWILFDKPVQADLLIILGDEMMKFAGVKLKSNENPKGIERFPVTPTGYSQVRAPLGVNLKPEACGARGWFDGVEHDIQCQLEWLASQPINEAEAAIKEAEKRRPKLASKATRRFARSRRLKQFPILEYVRTRRQGGSVIAQCPLCAEEGHDRHHDNLRIKSDGMTFCCVYGGPNQTHKVPDIIKALVGEGNGRKNK